TFDLTPVPTRRSSDLCSSKSYESYGVTTSPSTSIWVKARPLSVCVGWERTTATSSSPRVPVPSAVSASQDSQVISVIMSLLVVRSEEHTSELESRFDL